MNRFQNILYVSNGRDDETDGLKQALSLARNNAATLSVMIMAPDMPANLKEYENKLDKGLESFIRDAISKTSKSLEIKEPEQAPRIIIERGKSLGIRIIKSVLENNYDLVIKEAQPVAKRSGYKAVDMDLLRKCPCPVWLCRPISKPRQEMKVAVAIDPENEQQVGEDLALQMLQMSQSLSETCSGELHVVSCWDFEYEDFLRENVWVPVPEATLQQASANVQDTNHIALEKIIQKSGIDDQKAKINHFRGRPEDVIPKFVEDHDIDILIMGTLARTGIPGLTIGNTAENIVRELSCSLLALKPDGFVSPVQV